MYAVVNSFYLVVVVAATTPRAHFSTYFCVLIQAEEKRLALLADETAKIDGLLSEAELYKIQSESEITDTTEKFKRILTTQVAMLSKSLSLHAFIFLKHRKISRLSLSFLQLFLLLTRGAC